MAPRQVQEVVSAHPGVEEVNVYGVAIKGHDGRCGVACLSVKKGEPMDYAQMHRLVQALPSYAQPLFLRVRSGGMQISMYIPSTFFLFFLISHLFAALEITATFKHRKVELVKEGVDPEAVGDDVIMFHDVRAKTYVECTPQLYSDILAGKYKI